MTRISNDNKFTPDVRREAYGTLGKREKRSQCQIERQWATKKKKNGAQWDSGSRSNCNVLLPLTTTFVPISLSSLSPRLIDPSLPLSLDPLGSLSACVCVCVCCAFAALIPFNTNRIERSAISCDENINKKQHREKQKTRGAVEEQRRRRNLSINTYYIVALVAIVVAEQEIKIVQVLCRVSKR